MLLWEKLLNPMRLKELHGSQEVLGTAAGRTESERDYDRILFATPTRRLADKTQVFPMEQHDSVRTRLTHSHEVSNLARSIGVRLAFEYHETVFGEDHERLQVKRVIPSILGAVGLAHDLGNPPFGHQGELAIQQWFNNGGATQCRPAAVDFLEFDGNAQTFRLLTRLQVFFDKYGLNLTIGTLAALIKYPSIYGTDNKHGFKKHGVFSSEASIVQDVWDNTGLAAGVRHPLVYIMEACDDIAYSIIDAEDTVKKGCASFYDLMDFLISRCGADPTVNEVVQYSRRKNEEFKKEKLSSRELNDVSMQMFRVISIAKMIPAATDAFVSNLQKIMSGECDPEFELMSSSSCALLCSITKEFDKQYGFRNKDVLRLELQGDNHIKKMLSTLWKAIDGRDNKNQPFDRYVFGDISENYRRIYEGSPKGDYNKCQLICDAVSGMTESYLIKKNLEYKTLENVV